MLQTQVLIIGAGPIGLELAACLKAMDVDYQQIDAGQIGQTIAWYPRQVRFFSGPSRIAIAGLPLVTPDQSKATREEYLAYLRGVVEHHHLHIHTYLRATHLEKTENGFLVRCSHHGGEQYPIRCDQVVLAIGDMHHPRLLQVPGEDLPHVSHYFKEAHAYFRQKLLVIGGRNSAIEAALRCHHAGAQVTLSCRREDLDAEHVKYWLMPEIRSLIQHGHITFHPATQVQRITPRDVVLGPSVHSNEPDRAPFSVPTDFVLAMTGYVMDTTLLRQIGACLEGPGQAPWLDPQTQQTSVPGLYVAGTAAAGTQLQFRLFIENCHVHVERIVRAITGQPPPPHMVNDAAHRHGLPES